MKMHYLINHVFDFTQLRHSFMTYIFILEHLSRVIILLCIHITSNKQKLFQGYDCAVRYQEVTCEKT